MTLIIGIKCDDGIVLASDSAATFGTGLGQNTICQSTKKLTVIQKKLVVGTSGPIGLAQRFAGELEQMWIKRELADVEPYVAMTKIGEKLKKHISLEVPLASQFAGVLGTNAFSSTFSHTVVAVPIKKRLCLFEFDHQGAPEEKDQNLPFVSVGSGQPIADPFLAFLRRIWWPTGYPTMALGAATAYWSLDHAIKTNAGGVAYPINMVSLEKHDNDFLAREIEDQALEEHRQFIQGAEKYLTDYQSYFNSEKAEQSMPDDLSERLKPATLQP